MIIKNYRKIEHKVKKKKTIQVKEKVIETIQEEIVENVKIPIQRTRSVHHGPTGCGYCLRCNVILKDNMWIYRKAKECYLCYSCWKACTANEREKYREMAEYGYDSTEIYTDYEYREEKRIVPKKIEKIVYVDKEIEEEYVERTTYYPIIKRNIPYPQDNRVIYSRIDLDNLLYGSSNYASFYPPEDVCQDSEWFGAHSVGEAYNIILKSKKYTRFDFNYLDNVPFDDNNFDTVQKLDEFLDVVGFYPNVPAFLQGLPLNMYNNRRTNELSTTIYVNLALDSISRSEEYNYRGRIINGLIWYLKEVKNVNTNLVLFDATFIKGETFIQEIQIPFSIISSQNQIIYNLLTNVCFYRVLLLNRKFSQIERGQLSQEWEEGKGYVMRKKELMSFIEERSNNHNIQSIIFGDPIEYHIGGMDLKDDLIKSTQYAINSSLRATRRINPTFKIDVVELKTFIKDHGIVKLIHVTDRENVESIQNYGILTNRNLQSKDLTFVFNDTTRLEFNNDSVSLYITKPNENLYKKIFKQKYPDRHYVYFEIEPSILWIEKDERVIRRQYCDINMNNSNVQKSEDDISVMFKDMFKSGDFIFDRQKAKKQPNEPTSSRAEILFFDNIPIRYIMNINNPISL